MIRISMYHERHYKLTRGPRQRWFFGYNTMKQQYVAWSDSKGSTTEAKWFNSEADMNRCIGWYINHGWDLTQTYV